MIMHSKSHSKNSNSLSLSALTVFLLCTALLLPGLQVSAQTLDRVVAIVDEDVILLSELDERIRLIQEQIDAGNMPPPPARTDFRRQVLDQLILERLQLATAFRAGVRVNDNMLNQAMTDIARRNNMSFEEFRQMLESQGRYLTMREDLRRDIMINQVQTGVVNGRINITRQEIDNYLRSQTGMTAIAPEYRVAHILIPEGDADAQRQQELAELLYERIQDGEDIVQLAASRRVLGIPVSGGDLGWRRPEQLPSMFTQIVPTLRPGETAPPFTSTSGTHIVKLLETRGGTDLQVAQTRIRVIMIAPNEIRTEEQAEQFIYRLHERIRNGEDFAEIARQHTDEPGSMVSGGDIGWIATNQLPPEFAAIIDETDIGEMTDPFVIGTDWHIAMVTDRRIRDMTEENRRFRAEQALRERKFENELENWITELRDTAYIDIKL